MPGHVLEVLEDFRCTDELRLDPRSEGSASDDQVEVVRRRLFPLVGEGTGGLAGEMLVGMMTEGRGFPTSRPARARLDPRHPSWRQGFEEALT